MRRPEVGILALALLAAACAIPTEAPSWDTLWNVPLPDKGKLNLSVTSFLPSGVTADTVANIFTASVGSPPAITRTLGADCGSCVPINGTTAPKPAFSSAPPATSVTLAAGGSLQSGTLAGGSQVVFTIINGFNFDPIRPDSGSAVTNTGTVTLTVNNGTATLGTLTILGTAFGITRSATTVLPTMTLSGTINGASPISVTLTMNSPAGMKVPINTAQSFSLSAVPTIIISSATVSIPAQTVTGGTPDSVDLSSIPTSIANRVPNDPTNRGTMFLTITNPFTVGGAITLTLTGTKKDSTGTTTVITPV